MREPLSVRAIVAILLFGVAFGYVEAAVVTYLRDLHEPARQQFHPGRPPSELFPLLTLDQLRASGTIQSRTLGVELGREIATLAMLAAVALAVAGNAGQWAAAFVIAFGAWDVAFYLFLKLLIGWPATWWTWDILFLVPVPWVGPVIAPVLVSAAMIAAGIWHLRHPVELRRGHWSGMLAGALVIIVSFAMDYRNILSGGMPAPFHWEVFLAGLVMGAASYAWAAVSV